MLIYCSDKQQTQKNKKETSKYVGHIRSIDKVSERKIQGTYC